MKISEVTFSGTEAIENFLKTSPNDEVYTTQELAEQFGVPESTIKSSRRLNNYKVFYNGRSYYGSWQATTELSARIRHNEN